MTYSYRSTSGADIPLLSELYKTNDPVGVQREPWEEALTGAFLDINRGHSFMALDKTGTPVGHIFAGSTDRRMAIHHLYVHPHHRKHGIARELLRRVEDSARGAGFSDLCVGIVREEYRDQFIRKVGWDLDETVPMFQLDIKGDPSFPYDRHYVRRLCPKEINEAADFLRLLEHPHANEIERELRRAPLEIRDYFAAFVDDRLVGVLLGESSLFRGFLFDWAVDPAHQDASVILQLIQVYVDSMSMYGTRRILAAGHGDFRDQLLEQAGFVPLPQERIARKRL